MAVVLLPSLMPVEYGSPLDGGPLPALAQTAIDRQAEAEQLLKKGIQQFNSGQTQAALATFQQELAIRQAINDQQNIWRSYGWLGLIYARSGNYTRAPELHQQALTASQAVNNRAGIGSSLNNIGGIYSRLGEYPKALDFYQQSLAISRQIGDRRGVGESLNNIGGIYDSLGGVPKRLWIFTSNHSPLVDKLAIAVVKARCSTTLAGIYDSLGEYPKALDFYQQSLAISRQIGDRRGEGTMLNNIGGIYDSLGEYPKALDFYQQFTRHSSTNWRSPWRWRVAQQHWLYLRQSGGVPQKLWIFTSNHSPFVDKLAIREGEALTLHNLGSVWENQGQPELAIVLLKQAVNEYEIPP